VAVTATEKKIIAPAKLTAAQARLKLKESQAEIDKLNAEINELRNNYATCYICGKLKSSILNVVSLLNTMHKFC